MLAAAARAPRTLVLGIDAHATAMAESSRRAARHPRKGGLPNARFAVAAAESPPRDLLARADEVRIAFPWGSLLRGALALDEQAAAGIAALVAPGGRVTALLAPAERDRLDDVPTAEALLADGVDLAERWSAHGLDVVDLRRADPDEIRAFGSSWARRLRAAETRAVVRLDLIRPG